MNDTPRPPCFTIDRDTLKDALAWVARSVPRRPSRPALAGVLINVTRQEVTLSSYDHYNSATATVDPRDVSDEGAMLLDHGRLSTIIGTLPKKGVLTIAQDGRRVKLTAGRSEFLLSVMPDDEYPLIPEPPQQVGSIDASVFAGTVSRVAVAASKDETVPVLTGIHLAFEADGLRASATDKYRLATATATWQPTLSDETGAALVNADRLANLARSMAGSGQVGIGYSEEAGTISFHAGSRAATLSIIDGNFPVIEKFFQGETPITATVNAAEMLEAARRTALPVESPGGIKITLGDGAISLVGSNASGEVASESIDAEINGEWIVIGFRPHLIIPALEAQMHQKVQLGFTSGRAPALLTGVTSSGELDRSHLHLLMPIRDIEGVQP